jgi:hypothetical protein
VTLTSHPLLVLWSKNRIELYRYIAAIQERVTAVLRSILKEIFADSFQKLYERCEQCVVKDGYYFAGQ